MTDSLLFAGREQRRSAIPQEYFTQLDQMGQAVGDKTFADRKVDEALTIRWLSKRTGRGEREVEASLPSVMANYFGKEQIDASQAYDLIVATEAANAQGMAVQTGSPLPQADKSEAKAGTGERDKEKYPGWQIPRALGSGFQEFALQIPQGGFSAAAAVFADSMPKLDDGRTDEAFVNASEAAFKANQEAEAIKRLTGIDTGPSDEGKAALSAFEAKQVEKNTANKLALDKWRADNADSPLRQTAEFWRELADVTDERWGVDPVFANSTFGQFVKSTGSMPATSALMALGGMGLLGVGGATFAGVENDRMAYEGEDYDARAALMSNFINAGGQTVLEKVIHLDGVLEKALKTTARSGGKVVMSEFMRNIAKTAIGEGVEEMAQGQWDDMVATIAYDEKRGAIPFVDEGVAGRRFYEFMAGAAGGALMAGTFGGVMTLEQNRNARKAGEYLTTRSGSLLNEYDFKAYRAAYTDAQLADMKDGETLLKAANGDKQAQSDYNKAAAAAAFVSTDGMVDGEGNRLGSVDGKPAVFRADGAIVVVDTVNPEAMKAFTELQVALVARKAEVDAYQAERANVTNDLVDYITRLQTERGGSFTIEKGAKPKRLVDLKGEAGAKALYEQYVKAGKLPAGLDVNTLMIAGESSTRWDEKLRVWHTAIRISEGASPLAVIEESTEDHFKRLLETEEVTEDQVAGWREAVEQKTDKLEREGGIEWLSNYAVAYATGKAQEGDSRLPESFRRFLERFAAFVRESLELGRKLMQMERDGALPADFLKVLQESTGTMQAGDTRPSTQGQPGGLMSTFSVTDSKEPLPAFGNQSRINELMAVLEKHGDLYINAKGQAELVRMRSEGYQQAIDGAQLAERQRRKTGGLVSVIALPIDYRIERISPEIFRLLRDRTFQADTKATDDNRVVGAMYLKAKAMGETNLALLDHALANGHADVADTLAKTGGFTSELNAARAVFESQMLEALELGVPLGKFFVRENDLEGEALTAFRQAIAEAKKLPAGQAGARMAAIATESGFKRGVESYWPRRVMDRDGLLKSMGLAGIQEPFQKLLDKAEATAREAGRGLMEQEIDRLVDAANAAASRAAFQGAGKKPGALKARVLETVTAEQLKFYYKGIDAAFMHNTAMRNYLETLRFFGKSVVFSEGDVAGGFAEIPINVPQSVGAWVTDAALAGTMSEEQRTELNKILVDRFNYKVSGGFVQAFRMFSYLQNMTQITSALTANLAETWQGFYDSGSSPFRYGKNFVKAMSGLSKISLADVGQDPRKVAQEFDAIAGVDPKLKDAMRTLFTQPAMSFQRLFQWFSKRIGMEYFSRVMKESHMNGAVDYLIAQAQSGSLSRKQSEKLVRIFGEAKANQVLADLRGGNVTDDVKFYAFNVLANWQPISLDQMPQGYLANPYGRVFYMYKTWMSAQFAGFGRAAGEDIASGDAKRVASGVSTMLYLTMLLVAAGIPVDLIVAMIQGRGFILSDSAANRLLGMAGMSQYTAKSLKQRQWSDFLWSYFVPPAGGAATDVIDDSRALYYAGDEIELQKLKIWRNLPVFGRVFNGYLGHSAEAYEQKIEAAGGRIVLTGPDEQTKSDEEIEAATRARIIKQYSTK